MRRAYISISSALRVEEAWNWGAESPPDVTWITCAHGSFHPTPPKPKDDEILSKYLRTTGYIPRSHIWTRRSPLYNLWDRGWDSEGSTPAQQGPKR